MNNLQQYEKDERLALMDIVKTMDNLHATMGGRDARPERKALVKCMNILRREIERATQAYLKDHE